MAKTKPIGVRFDEVILKMVMENEKLETPQQVLSFYEKEYLSEDVKEEVKPEIKDVSINEFRTMKPLKLDNFKRIISKTPPEIKEKISNQLDALEINERIMQLEKELRQPPKEFSSSLMKRLYFSIREKELKQLKP